MFETITVNYVETFINKLKKESPMAFVSFLSGAGADQTEKSRAAFAKFKGKAEKVLLKDIDKLFIFRPGYIYPVTPRKEPNLMYIVTRFLYPLIRLFGNKVSIRSSDLAEAMFLSGFNSPSQSILENNEILDYMNS
ncbi:MAG: hypothetical protein P8M34_00070 [Saprospiraceae bacterium]|nr:hypothetical protein [Saprospiraceae bacterium]|tara:strand:- start:113 stop:520 length:408 start_codon:yes stop_codon:yes gene_type:complete